MRAAIYARYSSDLSRDASIEDQVRLCRAYAVRAGWQVTQVFEDRAISGASTIRPGYQRLLEAVLAGASMWCSPRRSTGSAATRRTSPRSTSGCSFSGQADHRQRGRDRRSPHRPQGRDERALPQGSRRQDPAGLGGPRPRRPQRRRALLRLRCGAGRRARRPQIAPEEAAIVRRIFSEFAAGRSPKAIARGLNDENVPGPRGILWRDTAIRGHRTRGTGILNNELYVGRLVWNRLRYVKDPRTGRRVSRQNPVEAWVVEDVPELSIIDVALWEAVKSRQAEIDATPGVQAMKASRFWEHRRATHLLTGLVRCSACGGGFAAVGRDYLACGNARKFARCDQRKAIRREVLEEVVLDLVRDRLMQPDAVKTFVAAYMREINAGRDDAEAARGRLQRSSTPSAGSSRAFTMPSATACGRRGSSARSSRWRPTSRSSRLNWPRRRRRRCGCIPTSPRSTAARSSHSAGRSPIR